MNARWHSFRLTTHDSGRVRYVIYNIRAVVINPPQNEYSFTYLSIIHYISIFRWCIGNEIHFKKKLQILTLIPLALLLIIATYLLITHFAFTKTNDTDSTGNIINYDDYLNSSSLI